MTSDMQYFVKQGELFFPFALYFYSFQMIHYFFCKLGDNMLAAAPYDVCDMSLIYQEEGFQYSLPRKVMEGFLSGKAFDHLVEYTEEESLRVCEDIRQIFETILSLDPDRDLVAIMTAGGPGAGKTIKMRQHLEEKKRSGKIYAYICPDDVCLKSQTRTYLKDIESSDYSKEARLGAYNKWRPASNAATHLILANLIRERYGFYFGTTSTGEATPKFFEFLKRHGYRIELIHVSATNAVRFGSIQERDKSFIQTTEKDVVEKGLLLPQRIMDTYLKYADRIEFYYRGSMREDAELGALWTRNMGDEGKLGTLDILSPFAYGQIKDIHNAAVASLGMLELSWEATVEANSEIP